MDAARGSMVALSTPSSMGPSRSSSGAGMRQLLHAQGQRQADGPRPAGEVGLRERVVQLVERLSLVDGALSAHDGLAVDPDAVDRVHDLVGRTVRCRRPPRSIARVGREGGADHRSPRLCRR